MTPAAILPLLDSDPAEGLRQTAADIRAEWQNDDVNHSAGQRAIALAVADLLDHAAARIEAKIAHGGKTVPVWSHEHDAITVASAYLGGAQ